MTIYKEKDYLYQLNVYTFYIDIQITTKNPAQKWAGLQLVVGCRETKPH
jgi:hypothetical protein